MSQWLYVEERQAQVEAGQWLSQQQTAARIHIRPTTISIWKRDPRFRRWYAEEVSAARDPLVEHAKTAIAVKTLQGHPKFAELFVAMHGLEALPVDPSMPNARPSALGGASAPAVSVTFVGIPPAPSAEERARLVPKPGESKILRDGKLIDVTPVAPKPKTDGKSGQSTDGP